MKNENPDQHNGSLTSGDNISFWIDTVKPLEFEAINNPASCDVLVIGAGIAGLTTAYQLVKSGKKVIVVDDGLIGSGESGRTTAHLTCALDDRYYNIEKLYGEEDAKKAAESHRAAIDWIENTIRKEQLDCDFERVDGFLFLHPSDDPDNLTKEYNATVKAGLSTQLLEDVPGIQLNNWPCIRFSNQAQFHIMKYLNGLAKKIVSSGGRIYIRSRAININEKGAECNGFEVTSSQVVVATNSPVNDLVTMHTKQFPYRTYVIGGRIPKGTLQPSLWWDTGDQNSKWRTAPYHYVRLHRLDDSYDLLIAGGEDHKTGQADDENIPEQDRFGRLIEWTKHHFPSMKEVSYKWSGQVLEPLDYMAYIGKNPGNDNIYIVTGDSGNGMTHGTLGGMIINDLINGIDNPWQELYSPKRIPLKLAGGYLSEAIDMATQYGDYLAKADINEISALSFGQGAILGKGLKRYAVYKDESGDVHAFSAVCPHLGCVVQWNAEEGSFDCPCHGSRFTKTGEVINGPATKGLKRIDLEAEVYKE